MDKKGLLIVISGPSGAGKGTICKLLHGMLPSVRDSISVTTRAPRPGEVEGVHYYFRTEEEYRRMIANGEFLETAEVYKNYYGTPKQPVYDMIAAGYDVLFDIDTLGAKQIKASYPDAVTIFVMPPSMAELERRLRGRHTDSEKAIRTRLSAAHRELNKAQRYDYFVINDSAETAAREIVGIVGAEKNRVYRNLEEIHRLLGE